MHTMNVVLYMRAHTHNEGDMHRHAHTHTELVLHIRAHTHILASTTVEVVLHSVHIHTMEVVRTCVQHMRACTHNEGGIARMCTYT